MFIITVKAAAQMLRQINNGLMAVRNMIVDVDYLKRRHFIFYQTEFLTSCVSIPLIIVDQNTRWTKTAALLHHKWIKLYA